MSQQTISGIQPLVETLEDLQRGLQFWRRVYKEKPGSRPAAQKAIDEVERKIRAMSGDLQSVQAEDVSRAIDQRFGGPGWAIMHEVQSRPGYSPSARSVKLARKDEQSEGAEPDLSLRSKRYLDTVVVGLWPSNKFEVIGIEIKVSRGDWLREVRDMTKSAAFVDRCSMFYVAAPKGVVKVDELPDGWGWMRFSRTNRGDSIRIAKHAKEKDPTIDRAFLAALLQRQKNPK